MRAPLLLMVCATLFAIAACGGGAEPSTPSPTPDTFDPNVLNALVLQPEEVPLPPRSAIFSGGGSRVTYTAAFGDPSYAVDVTISRTTDAIEREQQFSDLRSSVNTLIGGERNHELPGSDLAFSYKAVVMQTPNSGILAMKDDFIMLLTIASDDESQSERVFDDTVIDAYAALMFERIQRVADDPTAITPVPGAPTYAGTAREP